MLGLLMAALLGATPVDAQTITFSDVKAKNAVQLTTDELSDLMPGAKVVSHMAQGKTRTWQNKPDGTFIASSGARNDHSGGVGTWRVRDNGTLCVTIRSPTSPEDWCRYIFRAGSKYYAVGRRQDAAPANELEFTKQ